MRRSSLLPVALAATVLVGALSFGAVGAFATPLPDQVTEVSGVSPLVVPPGYRPSDFAAARSGQYLAASGLIVVSAGRAATLPDAGTSAATRKPSIADSPSGDDSAVTRGTTDSPKGSGSSHTGGSSIDAGAKSPSDDTSAADGSKNDTSAGEKAANDNAGKDNPAKDKAAKDNAAKDKTAADQGAADKAAKDKAAKDGSGSNGNNGDGNSTGTGGN